MKLSEAMRKGCEMTRPLKECTYKSENGFVTEACAIGAAMVGVMGTKLPETGSVPLHDIFPFLTISDGQVNGLGQRIIALNDSAGWSREHIADWLERQGY